MSSDYKTIDTFHGDHHKYEVRKKSNVFSNEYVVNKDGKADSGKFNTRKAAVDYAKEKSGIE